MGARGPKPMPDNVRMLRGNAGKRPLSVLNGSIDPPVEIPGVPKHLMPEARKEWKRAGAELEELGLITKIDRAAFALYCQEWAWWVWHDAGLQRDIKRAADKRAVWEADPANEGREWTGGDGFMLPTPNGGASYNPHWVAKNRAGQALDRYLASFGMSPSSRGRVSASSNQLSLPGIDAPVGGFAAL